MKVLNVSELTVEQKIGQLLMCRGVSSQKELDFVLELIKNHALGGVQVRADSQAAATISAIQQAADYPVFVAADMECGYEPGGLTIAGNIALGAVDDPMAAYHFARITATQAKAVGWNMIWGPVVDMAPVNAPCRICRCISANKEKTADIACAYMKGFADCGVIGTAKHYPSVSDIVIDTHMQEGASHMTEAELTEGPLYPYQKMIERLGSDMMGVMTGHFRCVNIDSEYPATLSSVLIGILRRMGFNGLVVTDSFAMMGVLQRFGEERALGLAIAAGNDLVLPNYRTSLAESYQQMMNCYRKGIFSVDRLNNAVSHVLKAQERTLRFPSTFNITEADRKAISRINRNSLCAITDPGLDIKLDTKGNHLFVILTENSYQEKNQTDSEINFITWWNSKHMTDLLRRYFLRSSFLTICEFPNSRQIEEVCVAATEHADIIFVTFCDTGAYYGTDGLTERIRNLIASLGEKVSMVVHTGNPYAMEQLPHIPRLLFCFQSSESMACIPEILSGNMKPSGCMPLPLKLH